MLPSYFRRLQIPPPSSSLLFIILNFLIICSHCGVSSKDVVSLDKFNCANKGAVLPTGVEITKTDQIRFTDQSQAVVFHVLLKQPEGGNHMLFIVVHNGCNFGSDKCYPEELPTNNNEYPPAGLCKTQNCTTQRLVCSEFNIYNIKEMPGAARVVTFLRNNNFNQPCKWEAFVDNARFLVSDLSDPNSEACVPRKGSKMVWVFVSIGVASLIIIAIAVSVVVLVVLRRKKLREKGGGGGQSTVVKPKQGQMPTESMWQRILKKPRVIFVRDRRGSKTKGGGGGKAGGGGGHSELDATTVSATSKFSVGGSTTTKTTNVHAGTSKTNLYSGY